MQAYLPKPAVIVVIHSAVKASAKCLTGHPRTKEKQGWVTSQRMRCDALGTSSAVRTRLQCAVTFAQIKKLQAYVTYYCNLVLMKTCKSLSLRKFICYLKYELCILNSLGHKTYWQSVIHETREYRNNWRPSYCDHHQCSWGWFF